MKNKLIYQTSEYDCGPTTLVNGLRFLFDREQISPEMLRAIHLYTLDSYNDDCEDGKSGTSAMAIRFLSCWFNQYGEKKKFPIYSVFLEKDSVYIGQTGRINECLQQGGAVLVWVWLDGEGHYVLLTGLDGDSVELFDPYYADDCMKYSNDGRIRIVSGGEDRMNRIVEAELLNNTGDCDYSMGAVVNREALLIYNTDTRRTPEKTIEYVI